MTTTTPARAAQPPRPGERTTQMSTSTITAGRRPGGVAGLAGRLRAAAGQLARTAHAAGDDRAQASGWTITCTPGPFGLSGRVYRDPRFAARRRQP